MEHALICVWNPIPEYISRPTQFSYGRSRLVYAVSRDDGTRWSKPVILENNPQGSFSHPAIHFAEDAVLIAYDVTLIDKRTHHFARIRRIPYDTLERGDMETP